MPCLRIMYIMSNDEYRGLLRLGGAVATLSCCHPAIILEPRLPLFLNSLALRSPSCRRCWLPIANYCEPGAPKFRPHCSHYRVNDTNCDFRVRAAGIHARVSWRPVGLLEYDARFRTLVRSRRASCEARWQLPDSICDPRSSPA